MFVETLDGGESTAPYLTVLDKGEEGTAAVANAIYLLLSQPIVPFGLVKKFMVVYLRPRGRVVEGL